VNKRLELVTLFAFLPTDQIVMDRTCSVQHGFLFVCSLSFLPYSISILDKNKLFFFLKPGFSYYIIKSFNTVSYLVKYRCF
jgi:hypothetical protein